MHKIVLKILLHMVVTVVLTALTQVGGVIYLISIIAFNPKTEKYRLKRLGLFVATYLVATFLIVPFLAPVWGREKVKNTKFIEAHTFFTILMNRNYVRPKMNIALEKIAKQLNIVSSK